MHRLGRTVKRVAAAASRQPIAPTPTTAAASRKLNATTPAKLSSTARPAGRRKQAKSHSEFYAEALRAAEEYNAMQAAKPAEVVELISDDEHDNNMHTASTDVSAHNSDENDSVYSAEKQSDSESDYDGSEASDAESEVSYAKEPQPASRKQPARRLPTTAKPSKRASKAVTAPAAVSSSSSVAASESDDASEVTDASTLPQATSTADESDPSEAAESTIKPKRQRRKAKTGESAEKPVKLPRVAKKDIPTVQNAQWYPTQELIDAGNALDRAGMRIGFPCMHTVSEIPNRERQSALQALATNTHYVRQCA